MSNLTVSFLTNDERNLELDPEPLTELSIVSKCKPNTLYLGLQCKLQDRNGRMRTETPTMFVTAPVRDDNLQVIAVLAMRIRPEREFTDMLQLARFGDTGETYAVNRQGLMVSNSRFDEQLMFLGILPDADDSASILKVQVRDPGGDLTNGYRPKLRRAKLPLTEICEAVVNGSSGINLIGYRDY